MAPSDMKKRRGAESLRTPMVTILCRTSWITMNLWSLISSTFVCHMHGGILDTVTLCMLCTTPQLPLRASHAEATRHRGVL